jgi:pimeloyl-ACP methyl ester carboxylesterase
LLANVMIYWVTQTANASARSYYERARDSRRFWPEPRLTVPTGVALTLEKVQRAPRTWVERVYTDLRHWTEFDQGGHFLALEAPELLAADIRKFFRQFRER